MGNTESNQVTRAREDASNARVSGKTSSGSGADPDAAASTLKMRSAAGLGNLEKKATDDSDPEPQQKSFGGRDTGPDGYFTKLREWRDRQRDKASASPQKKAYVGMLSESK